MDKLKPCPFCGSEGEMVQLYSDTYIVGCSNEDCPMWAGFGFNMKEHATRFWNTRTRNDKE